MEVQLFDENNNLLYVIRGNCCQMGIWLKGWPCKIFKYLLNFIFIYKIGEPCETVKFQVLDATD